MKKIMFFLNFILLTVFSHAQKVITPEEFFAKMSIKICDGFPKEISANSTDPGAFYLFDSPVNEDGHGMVTGGCPDFMSKTPIDGYIVRGGIAVRVMALTLSGPTYSLAWQNKLNRGRNVVPDADKITFSYSDPKVFSCEQLGYADNGDGKTKVNYGVYFGN